MRDYELVLIVSPELDDSGVNDVLNKVKTWITDEGGEVSKVDLWGKRTLAYPIRKQKEGQYALFETKMSANFGAQLERNLRYLEPVMRFLLVAK